MSTTEKKKRGRPRKNPPATKTSAEHALDFEAEARRLERLADDYRASAKHLRRAALIARGDSVRATNRRAKT